MNTETGEFKKLTDEEAEKFNKEEAVVASTEKLSERKWIRFDIGETINVKGQDFLIDEVDFEKHRLVLISKKKATGKEGMGEMMRRLQSQVSGEGPV